MVLTRTEAFLLRGRYFFADLHFTAVVCKVAAAVEADHVCAAARNACVREFRHGPRQIAVPATEEEIEQASKHGSQVSFLPWFSIVSDREIISP